jgi:hypothetical protein
VIERQHDVLRVDPEAISLIRAAFGAALDQVENSIINLGRSGYLRTPWLGDESSLEAAKHYTERAMEAPDSSYNALVAYRNELTRVYNTLQRMEDEYLGTDHQASADLRRRT